MASDEDNFDIDVYGDGGDEFIRDASPVVELEHPISQADGAVDEGPPPAQDVPAKDTPSAGIPPDSSRDTFRNDDIAQKIASTDESSSDVVRLPKQAPQTQGLKRKEGDIDDRHVDPNATNALFISDLHWWVTDDDIRGWANQSQCEDEVEEITFNEHKVNGKSKGQAYVSFTSPQSATAVKDKIQSFTQGQQYAKMFVVNFTNPSNNPFRTLPKDGPMRNAPASNHRSGPASSGTYGSGGYRGRGYGRGHTTNGYNRGAFQGGFQASSGMGNFSQMGSAPFGGYQGRGGMGGMRGSTLNNIRGRGGMMNMPMGMGMGAMAMGMGMGVPGMAGMGMAGNAGAFNPAFFGAHQASPTFGADNPHGAKRTRQD